MIERRLTWLLIVSRDVTENTPGPVITSFAEGVSPAAVSNACRIAPMACSWASVSEPAARVCTSIKAREPSPEAHAPSTSFGGDFRLNWSSNPTISPVGSRGNSDLTSSPAGEASRSMLSLRAACRPSTLNLAGVTAGLSRKRLPNRKARSRSVLTGSPLFTVTKAGSARRRWAVCFDSRARVGASAPSIPTRISLEARPSRSWSMSSFCSGVGARGRNADRSVVKWVRLTMATQASRNASHSAIAEAPRRRVALIARSSISR